jgi:hypothetical protein
VAVPEIGELGEDPSRVDLLLPLPRFHQSGGIPGLTGAALDAVPLSEHEIGHEAAHAQVGDPRPIDGHALPRPQKDGPGRGGFVLRSHDDLELRVLPIPAVARLVEMEAAVGQGMVDLDDLRPHGLAVLEDRDRAFPGFDAALRIELGLEAVEAHPEARMRDIGGLPLDEGQVGPASGQAADDPARQDDQQAEVDGVAAEPAEPPLAADDHGPVIATGHPHGVAA